MNYQRILVVGFFLVLLALIAGCSSGGQVQDQQSNLLPEELAKAEAVFKKNCASCHGEKAAGTDKGPSFLDQVYAPGHHADQSFILAAKNGVREHHWNFGNMPAVPGASDDDLSLIIQCVRYLQQQAGIS